MQKRCERFHKQCRNSARQQEEQCCLTCCTPRLSTMFIRPLVQNEVQPVFFDNVAECVGLTIIQPQCVAFGKVLEKTGMEPWWLLYFSSLLFYIVVHTSLVHR